MSSSSEGRRLGSRQPTLPPLSSRTLHHPSFLPLYVAADRADDSRSFPAVRPVAPAELFYSDPTMSCGRRIPNRVSELRVFDCFQLNTPPPVMSACPAPQAHPDMFRSGPHPTRDLGSPTMTINTLHPSVRPSRVVVQLTQEEDQAITNLLKLHHQEPAHGDETLISPQIDFSSGHMDSASVDEAHKPFRGGVQHLREARLRGRLQQGRRWSDTELDAADTLLSRFSLMVKNEIRGQNHSKSAAALPDPLPRHRQGSETRTKSITTDCTQHGVGQVGFSCAGGHREPGCRDFGFAEGASADVHLPSPSADSEAKSGSSVSGGFSKAKERTLSESEGDAVHVLLSIGDMGAPDVAQ